MFRHLLAVLVGLLVFAPIPCVYAQGGASPWFVKDPKARSIGTFLDQLRAGHDLRVRPELYGHALGESTVIPADRAGIVDFFDPRKNNRIKIIPCTPALLQKYEVAGVGADGGVVWSSRRKSCYEDEEFVVYVNNNTSVTPLVSLACGNPLRVKVRVVQTLKVKPLPEKPFVPVPIQQAFGGSCPMGKSVQFLVWPWSKIPDDLQGRIEVLVQHTRDFVTEDVSRTLGKELRALYSQGKLPRASGIHGIEVAWIKLRPRDSGHFDTEILERRGESVVRIENGYRKVYYDAHLFDTFTLQAQTLLGENDRYKSPSLGDNGRRELRSFPTERTGCSTYIHLIDATQ